jgi:hypothetical protein
MESFTSNVPGLRKYTPLPDENPLITQLSTRRLLALQTIPVPVLPWLLIASPRRVTVSAPGYMNMPSPEKTDIPAYKPAGAVIETACVMVKGP